MVEITSDPVIVRWQVGFSVGLVARELEQPGHFVIVKSVMTDQCCTVKVSRSLCLSVMWPT